MVPELEGDATMERKRALVIAGSVGLSVLAGGAAMAANFGLLDAAGDGSPVGELDASNVSDLADAVPVADTGTPTDQTTATSAEVVVIDEWVTEPGGAPIVVDGTPSAPTMDAGGAAAQAPTTPAAAPSADQPGSAPAVTEAPRTTSPAATAPSTGPEHGVEYEHEEEHEHEGEYEHEEEEEEHDDDHAEVEHEEEDD